ncbi:rubrerythrin family protein [Ramlibacter sp. G-1-2-2]|uniref:Rubrerythrin family protein n=1 Tax=Ramlibacter agri TaxID=2728837 RepID=A0A848H4R8_9BURK|nr:VIT1/CCC1 family protein [Ramlibacter agri]NML43613.1 rubrerythrin family protein [Ramlibacter agri]
MADGSDLARYRRNLQGEVDGASLYRTLAQVEQDPHVAEVYRRLASVEDAHAELWRRRIEQAGQQPGAASASWRTRMLAFVARHFGPDAVLPVVNSLEQVDSAQYDRQPEAIAARLPQAERSHARILQALTARLPGGLPGSVLERLEGRHRSGGNTLRAAVLGANDGLVSNLSLVAGVAGANPDTHVLLVTGLAGMLAGACSMAMGEWLSVTTSREMQQSQIAAEAEELDQAPEEEKEELALIYQSKGLPEAQAQALADKLMANRDTALDTLAREELGVDPQELGGSPWAAAASSFLLFTAGSLCPVLGLVIADGTRALWLSLAFSIAGLFVIGAGTSIFTGRGWLFSGLRQAVIGLGAAAVTFGLGRLIGVSLGG